MAYTRARPSSSYTPYTLVRLRPSSSEYPAKYVSLKPTSSQFSEPSYTRLFPSSGDYNAVDASGWDSALYGSAWADHAIRSFQQDGYDALYISDPLIVDYTPKNIAASGVDTGVVQSAKWVTLKVKFIHGCGGGIHSFSMAPYSSGFMYSYMPRDMYVYAPPSNISAGDNSAFGNASVVELTQRLHALGFNTSYVMNNTTVQHV